MSGGNKNGIYKRCNENKVNQAKHFRPLKEAEINQG